MAACRGRTAIAGSGCRALWIAMEYRAELPRNGGLQFLASLGLRFTASLRIDGLWVGTIERDSGSVLARLEQALRLIKTYDRRRYDRLVRDLDLIWVRRRLGGDSRFNASRHACELDTHFILAATSRPDVIAAAIVRAATCARLHRRGLDARQELQARLDAACSRQVLAFMARLQCERGAELETSGLDAPVRVRRRRDWKKLHRSALHWIVMGLGRCVIRLLDAIERRLSTGRRVDGLWIGTCQSEAEHILSRVEQALD